MKIAFITNVPSPYRVDFFNELGKHCELTVFFEKKHSDERDKSWDKNNFLNFNGVFLEGIKSDVDKALSLEICKYLKKDAFDFIVVANVATPTGIIAILYMKAMGIPYWIEGDGAFAKSGKGMKEALKRFLMKSAKGCFSTSAEHDNYYRTYGVSSDVIYRYSFTAIYEEDIRKKPFNDAEKDIVRRELGISEDRYIVTVGQFIYRKGIDVLLKAAKELPKDVGIYIIGGTPTEEYISLKNEANLSNVHFISFTDKATLKKWYGGAEIMVLPTREDIWGLVVNEALAQGTPVVTTDRCIAGLELVKNEENGYIVPVGEVSSLADKINTILADSGLQQRMANNCLKIIKEYTFERMVQSHMDIFNKFTN